MVVRLWKRLSREAVTAPFLKVFKPMLDRAWSNLIEWKVPLPITGGWN